MKQNHGPFAYLPRKHERDPLTILAPVMLILGLLLFAAFVSNNVFAKVANNVNEARQFERLYMEGY